MEFENVRRFPYICTKLVYTLKLPYQFTFVGVFYPFIKEFNLGWILIVEHIKYRN